MDPGHKLLIFQRKSCSDIVPLMPEQRKNQCRPNCLNSPWIHSAHSDNACIRSKPVAIICPPKGSSSDIGMEGVLAVPWACLCRKFTRILDFILWKTVSARSSLRWLRQWECLCTICVGAFPGNCMGTQSAIRRQHKLSFCQNALPVDVSPGCFLPKSCT